MSEDKELHRRLIARQSDAELERKAEKAWMRKGKLWTREEMDAADREAKRLYEAIRWDGPSSSNGES